ncbi:DNA ligase D [Consotaella salsifontis]|uniref:DNA ligase (ATP) n=1 Tax=Consotaella salsifontis TaxID=1365950 RepID=A0A1T4T6B1_9HYPH|nr:DNA ligase D [Consotaella salsifontis]SKA35927.1 ATP-dependent DNA ligase LigD phosphoesterase module /ATP-dependent DNA ligase LigD polymerase module [Consotaella salsifontis]
MAATTRHLLKSYREKRDFSQTAEPSGDAAPRAGKDLFFCVQKHDATRLHYDFRVEWEGVLKSWAVTRGPSFDPADKRLAVRTEDHPLDYGDFEGTIPKGQYGGGTVMLWDRGTWEPVGDAEAGLAEGSLKMILHGEKLVGHWALVRMKPKKGEKRENWLLIKEKDEHADPDRHVTDEMPLSVKTGGDLDAIANGHSPVWHSRKAKSSEKPAADKKKPVKRTGKALALPAFRPVQLATLTDTPPEGSDWLSEMKYDGYRALVAVAAEEAKLYTRTGLDWTERFAALLPSLQALACKSALLDGEVVAFDEHGGTDFSTLQKRLKEGGELAYFAFDLLELDGADLSRLPLIERKSRLEKLVRETNQPALLFSEHVRGRASAVLKGICAAGHEGIVAKRADAPYREGRGTSWLKVKCGRRQEFVIGGFAATDKKRRAFRSILLGTWEEGRLHYRGKVGSGFGDGQMAELMERFEALKTKASPFADLPREARRGATFIEPTLVAEVSFAELTADGNIRHGVFKGLREDKAATEVVDERPAGTPPKTQPKGKGAAAMTNDDAARVAGVRLTHPDRVLFESQGLTKRDLAHYYERAAERMLVYAGGRPLSLVRCPQGRQKACFFQKHDSGGFPESVRKIPITEKDGSTEDYLYVSDAAGLVSALQMNALEFHIWGSRNDRIENPDRMVFDLDPDEELGFDAVKAAAIDLKDRLGRLGLDSFPLVSGGKGVHVVAPLSRRQDWTSVKAFARAFANTAADEEPQRYVATMSKAKRKGRIFIDWLRNERGSTAIAPYSTRSRQGAPVATPVSWEELEGLAAANVFHPADVLARLDQPDPWSDYAGVRQSLTKKALSGVGLA